MSTFTVQLCDVSTYTPSTDLEWNRRCLVHLPTHSDIRDRIQRYQKGCASPSQFDPKSHDDTKCFLFGRLMLQAAAASAATQFTTQPNDEVDPQTAVAAVPVDEIFGTTAHHSTPSVDGCSMPRLHIAKTAEGKPRVTTGGKPLPERWVLPEYWNASVTHHGRVVGLASSGWESRAGVEATASRPSTSTSPLVGLDVMQIELVPLPKRFLDHSL